MIKKSVIITAGGVGSRMGSAIPKQFLEIDGKPILLHTISRFLEFDSQIELILVLPESYVHVWEEICQKYFFTANHKVVAGGSERFFSIKNGLEEVTGDVVAVHDAVRPFVSVEVIQACFDAAQKTGAAIPVLDISESIRKIEKEQSYALNREDYKLVQTPQCFQTSLIRDAYSQSYSKLFTDDASVVEATGHAITLVSGNRENIKITTPLDLDWAQFIVTRSSTL